MYLCFNKKENIRRNRQISLRSKGYKRIGCLRYFITRDNNKFYHVHHQEEYLIQKPKKQNQHNYLIYLNIILHFLKILDLMNKMATIATIFPSLALVKNVVTKRLYAMRVMQKNQCQTNIKVMSLFL